MTTTYSTSRKLQTIFECLSPVPQEKAEQLLNRIKAIHDSVDWNSEDYEVAKAALNNRECSLLLAKDRNNVIVGYALLNPCIKSMHVSQLAVDKSQHGNGVGTLLMQRIFEETVKSNKEFFSLQTYPGNRELLKFYDKFLKRYGGTFKEIDRSISQYTFNVGVDATDVSKEISLHKAAASGNAVAIRKLIARGALIESRDDKAYETPLQKAASGGHLGALKVLLLRGANVHAQDLEGSTALHKAADNGRARVVSKLLDVGAVIGAIDFCGETPASRAEKGGHKKTIQMLKKVGNKIH